MNADEDSPDIWEVAAAVSASRIDALVAHTGSSADGEILMWRVTQILDIGTFRINEDVR